MGFIENLGRQKTAELEAQKREARERATRVQESNKREAQELREKKKRDTQAINEAKKCLQASQFPQLVRRLAGAIEGHIETKEEMRGHGYSPDFCKLVRWVDLI